MSRSKIHNKPAKGHCFNIYISSDDTIEAQIYYGQDKKIDTFWINPRNLSKTGDQLALTLRECQEKTICSQSDIESIKEQIDSSGYVRLDLSYISTVNNGVIFKRIKPLRNK